MNTNAISVSVCMGCLSGDRKLQLLNQECKQTFCGFLDLFDHSQPMYLCFECIEFLQRAMRFKKQAKLAYTFLLSYSLHNKIPKTLSKLDFGNKICFDNLSDAETKYPNYVVIHSNNSGILKDCNVVKYEYHDQESNKFNQESNKFDQETNKLDQESNNYDDQQLNKHNTEPLDFIKMENVDLDMDSDHNNGIDDQDFKVKKDFKTAFSDSDDEPLMKSKKHIDKCKRRKEKQDSHESSKPKRRKNREQASGVVTDPRVDKKLRDLNIEGGHIALVMLSWEEVEEERRLALQGVSFTRHAHRCTPCIVGYNHRHKLEEHNRKHSVEAGSEVCDICTVRCKTRAALASHRRRHRARWICQYCGARYSQACVAADHCARAHRTAPPTHRCPRCPHTAHSLGALRMHIKSHSSRPECTLCGKTFRDKNSLRTHGFVHRGVKEHACSVCDKRFTFKKQMQIHEITHMDHQHLYCHQCDVSFKNQTSYYQHMKYNLKHIDPADIKHACQLCDKRFVKAKRLEEHNLAVHLKLAPIKCIAPDCTFACPSRAALRSHVRLVHRGARALRNHVCHRCGNTYKSKKSLEGHLRSHRTPPRQTTQATT